MSTIPTIVAIDGPAGAGKSTVARTLAARLGFVLLDTGALYRAIALAARNDGVAWTDRDGVAAVARGIAERGALTLETGEAGSVRVMLGGNDVSRAIRKPEISMGASAVSAIGGVRDALLDLQRSLATREEIAGTVAEGRDMGTVVFADAAVKFFLTASLDVRAGRRQAELAAAGSEVDLEQTKAEVAQRDKQDRERAVAPLKQADDALLVDSTGRGVEDVVDEMERAVRDARP